jgi:molybdopterin-containing oxidoreductase family membrane subunit
VPSPLHHVNEYAPTIPEILITLGIYAMGALVLTALFKMAISVKEEVAG